ncbi:unnamed protein product [Didymodactylos carnosus]|uniref:Uncharacterized protein n=1 Tax=Didymodactylos carnosus TaxID=1234261 RepID=A0A8S2SWW4_9BILA|nr:unnamed protein product [Didymodactylos carnosus]CAF4247967.1 unnamed protein product [Didymodactylos carnosus]
MPSQCSVFRIVTHYNNLSLNSANDVIISCNDQSMCFTDSQYGFMQIFHYCQPQLDNNVYGSDINEDFQILVNNLVKPDGIGVYPEETILYVIDNGCTVANGSINSHVPCAIYSHQIYRQPYKHIHFYNKRLLTRVQSRIPDEIKVD